MPVSSYLRQTHPSTNGDAGQDMKEDAVKLLDLIFDLNNHRQPRGGGAGVHWGYSGAYLIEVFKGSRGKQVAERGVWGMRGTPGGA